MSERGTGLEVFLALLAARRAPRTVDAYRRDLTALRAHLDGPIPEATSVEPRALDRPAPRRRPLGRDVARRARRREASSATSNCSARAPTTPPPRSAPRAGREAAATLSAAEAERLIDAAAGTTPRALRDRALVELLYGAGLRVSEAVGLDRAGVDLDDRLVRVIGKGDKERIVPIGRHSAEALRRYLSRGRPFLDRRTRPELFLNARAAR